MNEKEKNWVANRIVRNSKDLCFVYGKERDCVMTIIWKNDTNIEKDRWAIVPLLTNRDPERGIYSYIHISV